MRREVITPRSPLPVVALVAVSLAVAFSCATGFFAMVGCASSTPRPRVTSPVPRGTGIGTLGVNLTDTGDLLSAGDLFNLADSWVVVPCPNGCNSHTCTLAVCYATRASQPHYLVGDGKWDEWKAPGR